MHGLFSLIGRCLVMSSPVLVGYALKKYDPSSVTPVSVVQSAESGCCQCKVKTQA